MVSLFKLLANLLDASSHDFAAWEIELETTELRLTSSAWTGWYEE